jgi:hypothetical protein
VKKKKGVESAKGSEVPERAEVSKAGPSKVGSSEGSRETRSAEVGVDGRVMLWLLREIVSQLKKLRNDLKYQWAYEDDPMHPIESEPTSPTPEELAEESEEIKSEKGEDDMQVELEELLDEIGSEGEGSTWEKTRKRLREGVQRLGEDPSSESTRDESSSGEEGETLRE